MIVTGKLIEYLDNGKFICALVTESQPKKLRLINQNGREVNLPLSRVVHSSVESHPTELSRESVTKHLQETTAKRSALMDHINLREIWELTSEESSNAFSPAFLTELVFGSEATDNTISAFLRCVFEDKLFFKYKEGRILANSAEKVKLLQIQLEKENKRAELIRESGGAIARIMEASTSPKEFDPIQVELLDLIRDYYLFGSDAAEAQTT